jgi:hypothetical protein
MLPPSSSFSHLRPTLSRSSRASNGGSLVLLHGIDTLGFHMLGLENFSFEIHAMCRSEKGLMKRDHAVGL